MTLEFIDGNEAIVMAALDAGCNFFAGYPITPASPICNLMARELPKVGGIYIQGEDEIASLGFCIAASVAGKKVMTATSGPGLSLYSENIGLAIMGEVPVVIVISQRQGPATGSATDGADGDIQFARWVTSGGFPVVALMPANVPQCYTFTIRCFNLAEQLRSPVYLLVNKEISMTKELVDWSKVEKPEIIQRNYFVPTEGQQYMPHYFEDLGDVPSFYPMGDKIRVRFTTSSHDAFAQYCRDPAIIDKMTRHFCQKIMANIDKITCVEKDLQPDAKILVISLGITSRASTEAIRCARKNGIKVSHLIIYSPWPAPEKEIVQAAKTVEKIIVAEWNLGQYVYEIQRIIKDKQITSVCKMDTTLILPQEILAEIVR